MRRFARTPVLVTLGMVFSLLLGLGITSASAASSRKPEYQATYQMYANVTSDGAVSGYDVANVLTEPGPEYVVYFKNPIDSCAVVAQLPAEHYTIGEVALVSSYPSVPDAAYVIIGVPVNGTIHQVADSFTLVVTCKS